MWIYIKCKSPCPFVAWPYFTQMGSPVRDHMLPIWQLHWAFLSVSWMMFKNKLYKDKKISIFKNKRGSCPCHAVLCWCSLKSSPPFRFYYSPCGSDSSFDREVCFLDCFFRWYLLVSKTQDLILNLILFFVIFYQKREKYTPEVPVLEQISKIL